MANRVGKHAGSELSPESGETQDDLRVLMLEEGLLHGLGEVVHGGAGSLKLGEKREHLPAQGLLRQRRMASPLGSEDLPEPLGLGLDSPPAASTPTGCCDLGAGQAGSVGRIRLRPEQLN